MLRLLLFSGATLLTAAPQPHPFNHPLVFEPNRGQTASAVSWLARGPGYQLFLTSDAATFVLPDRSAVRMKLNGSQGWNTPAGLEPTGGVSNYFLGADSNRWLTGIPHYGRVKTTNVYEGVDLVFYRGAGGNLEYDFVVSPGADPKQIRLAFDGVERLRVDDKTGDLVLTAANGAELRQLRPKVYQQVGDRRVEVAGGYAILDRRQATFALAKYDRRRPLVIDPTTVYTTFLDGSGGDVAKGVAADTAGNAYVTGDTNSTNFPIAAGVQPRLAGDVDAFVTKLNSSGAILFSTYLGGSGLDEGNGIAIDSSGVYISGTTYSSNFPTRGSPRPYGGLSDVFVTKLALNGAYLIYSIYLGGSGFDQGSAIAVDSSTQVYVTGFTDSTDFPVVGAIQSAYHGGRDVFVTKLSYSGGSLIYSTYWGGASDDEAASVAVDSSGYAYVTGFTYSPDFPKTNFFQFQGGDAFAMKLSPTGALAYSVIFGGSSEDYATAIAVDTNGTAYIAGYTLSADFPTSTTAFQSVRPGLGVNAFLVKLNSIGGVAFGSYLGANDGATYANAVAITSAGEAYVAGYTTSSHFPQAPPLKPNPTAGFLSKFTAAGNALEYSTLLGAQINGIAVVQYRPRLGIIVTDVFNAGMRYLPGTTNEDAFVVELQENTIY